MVDEPAPDSPPPDDDSFLGELLGEMVRAVEEGAPYDVESATARRPERRASIHETWRLAQAIAVRAPRRVPEIPGFRVLGEIGRGAMGTVYSAIQLGLQRRVALKLMPPAWTVSEHARERFLREARAAAALDHPHIVRIHECGEAERTPYIVMEEIDGKPLDAIVSSLKSIKPAAELSGADLARAAGADPDAGTPRGYVDAVARMVRDLADALEYAHARGVVHRDVKPSNILLRKDGRAVLTDFGLARQTGAESLTTSGEFLGTPHYAAPEQFESGKSVDGRADVYALGVTLFECLALRRPFEGDSSQQIIHAVLHADPTPLRRVAPFVAKDLETICSVAMERSPARRYASAGALRDDLTRFLECRPITAKPASPAVRALRWMQRHKAATAAAALAVLLVVGTPSVLWLQSLQHNEELQAKIRVAEKESKKAIEINNFYGEILSQTSPFAGKPGAKLVDVLKDAGRRLDESPPKDPEGELIIRFRVGIALNAVGDSAAAEAHFRRIFELFEGGVRKEPRDYARCMYGLGLALVQQGKAKDAAPVLEQAAALLTDAFGERNVDAVNARYNLGYAYLKMGDAARGEPILEELLNTYGAPGEEASLLRARVRMLLAKARVKEKKVPEAEKLLRDAVADGREHLGDDHLALLAAIDDLASLLIETKRGDEALKLLDDAVPRARRTLEPDNTTRASLSMSLARLCTTSRRCDDALALLAEVEPLTRAAGPLRGRYRGDALLLQMLNYDFRTQAPQLEATAAELARELGPRKDSPSYWQALVFRGTALETLGRLDEARELYETVLHTERTVTGERALDRALLSLYYGRCTARAGDAAGAERVVAAAMQLKTLLSGTDPQGRYYWEVVAQALEAVGKSDVAAQIRSKLREKAASAPAR